MKIALLKHMATDSSDINDQFTSVANNSGNIVYWESIIRLFDATVVPFDRIEDLKNFDACIITDLCWIRENAEYGYLEKIVDSYNIPFIPMSIGLQNNNFNPDFQLHFETIRLLDKLQKRAVLGVRGQYSANILMKYGITNIQVIGCPSMYYWNNRDLKIETDSNNGEIICNFKSLGNKLNEKEIEVLNYFANSNMWFVEQTQGKLALDHVGNKEIYQRINNWLNENLILEFSYKNWIDKIKNKLFSIGCRFHGNVISLHQGIKSLFITIDSRTQEMIDFFHLPCINISDFDDSKPISYYIDKADYTEFNNNYAVIYDNFIDFLNKNKIKISDKAVPLKFGQHITKINIVDENKQKEETGKSITISLKKIKNIISYQFDINGDWKSCFNLRRPFDIEYDVNIENCPNSVAVIPILSVLLPVSWVEDATIIVEEIDEDFLECIDVVKRNYAYLFPHIKFKGALKYTNVIKNKVDRLQNKSLCLYSGGVDATETLINNLNLKPTILTIWGTDIPLENEDAWNIVTKTNAKTAEEYNLVYTTLKSAFRYILNEHNLTIKWAKTPHYSWWHDFMHGIALLGQVAPYAYVKDISNIIIASSYSVKDDSKTICASLPFFDENVRYCGCRVYHDSFHMTRIDKLRAIVNFASKNNKKFNLRVCWEHINGYNCCYCEKCLRTIVGLWALGANPHDYGFNITEDIENLVIDKIKKKQIVFNVAHWEENIKILNQNKENLKNNKVVEELLREVNLTETKDNFEPTILIKGD